MTDATLAACALADRERIATDYAAGRLSGEPGDAFENHLLSCPRCQDEVALALGIRTALRGDRRPGRQRRPLAVVTVVGLLAAGLAAVLIWPARDTPGPALQSFGSVQEPPAYLGIAVRAGGPADSALEEAMRLYDQSRWTDAVARLRAAAAAGAPADVAAFFLGASALMAGDAAAADSAFGVVLAAGDGPYLNEAGFYRAKALLRLGRGGEALRALSAVPAATTIGGHASALADSLRAAGVR